jgi:hypothetical protein
MHLHISLQTYTYSKIQSANREMKKLRNDVRNKKETLQKLIENYENGILPRINFVQIISYHNKPNCCNNTPGSKHFILIFSKYSFILHSKMRVNCEFENYISDE